MHRIDVFLLFFILGFLFILDAQNSFAEVFSQALGGSKSCLSFLGSSEVLESKPSADGKISAAARIFLSLLEQTVAEIGYLKASSFPSDPIANQFQILKVVASSPLPIDPLEEFAMDPRTLILITQSHLLELMYSKQVFLKAIANLNENDWSIVRKIASEKLNSLQLQNQIKNVTRKDSKQNFVEAAPDLDGRVRLHSLIQNRNFEEAIALLQKPSITTRYVNTRDKSNKTPRDIFDQVSPHPRDAIGEELEFALDSRDAMTGSQLSDLDMKLFKSISEGSGIFIEFAYSLGANLNFKNPLTNDGILFHAIYQSKLEFVRELLRFDVDLNALSYQRKTPIQVAVEEQNTEIVKVLGRAGADLTVPLSKFNLVELAIEFKDWKTLRALAELGIDLKSSRFYPVTPFFQLLDVEDPDKENRNYSEPLQIFKDFKIDLNQINSIEGQTQAHYAVGSRSASFLSSLAEHGMDIDQPTEEGIHPLDLMFSVESPVIQRILEIYYNFYSARGILPASRGITRTVGKHKDIAYHFMSNKRKGRTR